MEQTLTRVPLNSIDTYNRLYGLGTLHPLVSVVDLRQSTRTVNHVIMDYGVYALFLKNGTNCTLKYGRQPYDYQEGTVVSFSPGQLIEVETPDDEVAPDVLGLLFHPDLIYRTPLAARIRDYRFFDYSQREAVHLSADERSLFIECLGRIKAETERPVDRHTAGIVTSHIQLLLDYMTRFYDRQFITRHKPQSEILDAFESALKGYYDSGSAQDLPEVSLFAARVNLTPGYFSDLIKKETGKTPQEIISLHIIELAKDRLASTADDVSVIAYDLGFQHPQHFSRMFKRMTGITPSQYRLRMKSA